MGEAKLKRRFWSDAEAPAKTSMDLVWPGDEVWLLKQNGVKPEKCRVALGRALYDLVTGSGICGACDKRLESLDSLGCVAVTYIEVLGRLVTSPSWSFCRECCDHADDNKGTTYPVQLASKLVHDFLAKQGKSSAPHPTERKR